jgi:hypothetical protein
MNQFFDMLANSIGSDVTGRKKGVPFLGYISSVKPIVGDDVMVYLTYDVDTVKDTSDAGTMVLSSALMNGGDDTYTNLHVYF